MQLPGKLGRLIDRNNINLTKNPKIIKTAAEYINPGKPRELYVCFMSLYRQIQYLSKLLEIPKTACVFEWKTRFFFKTCDNFGN